MLFPLSGNGQNIFRFDHIGSEEGLSQNTGFTIFFDSKGFMWVGTWSGLNRYDGYEFKVFRSSSGNPASFTNNRVVKIWEDKKGFIWLETYDGYYHFFNPLTEIFSSIPPYEGSDIRNGAMKFFLQYSDDIILLGSSESGLYLLRHDGLKNTYNVRHITAGPDSIPDNRIRFIHRDSRNDIWIGTKMGLCHIAAGGIAGLSLTADQKFTGIAFTSVCETGNELWFGTEENGIRIIDYRSGNIREITKSNTKGFRSDRITHLYCTASGEILAGLRDNGLMITSDRGMVWNSVTFHSKNLDKVYEDRFNQLWLTAVEFGVTRLDLKSRKTKFYVLTPEETRPLTDLERPQFYEDIHDNLWLGLHGNGLGLYDRNKDSFRFFTNDPRDPNTISSNIVHCITEDRSGQLWIGTGQVLGGIEKVIADNSAFRHYLPEKNPADVLDNVSRAIMEDRQGCLWVGTKAGKIHLFDSSYNQIKTFYSLPGIGRESFRNNVYSFLNDSRSYLWIGSKGYGVSVSTKPLDLLKKGYGDITFRRYIYSPDDSLGQGGNNIYSICEDRTGRIWVGTYGNGLNLIKDPFGKDPGIVRINQQNSNLSSNLVRQLLVDSSGNLWVATTFGLNLLESKDLEKENYHFRVFLKNPADENSLAYNDVIHIFQDSKKRLWFGTFGGGVDQLSGTESGNASFRHFVSDAGPGYGIIYGILEDKKGNIWLSSENGLISLDPENGVTEIFDASNGLGFNGFSENTCFRKSDGTLLFGGYLGFEAVNPEKLVPKQAKPGIELTKFLLFNKEVVPGQKNSPLSRSITFSDALKLKYFQSSFSIEFSALDYLDPDKVQYLYKLDNFENSWNNIGNQHRATYTNLSPGRYTFRVKSIMNEGKTASFERLLNIRITPPLWKTIPAYIFYTALIAAISIFIFNVATRINRYKNALAVEKRINELKLQFFTNISHEIRTPLTMIIGPLEDMVAEKNLHPVKKLQMGIMLKNARRMLGLTNQLLDFRKVQNNKMVLKIKEIDIVAFAREIFESFGPLASHKGLTYRFSCAFESLKLYADPGKLDIIIYNIVSNAIKFTSPGKTVSILIEEPENQGFVDIIVTDEGPGIPEKDLSEIFTRYTILSNQDLAGTGIGLALSYELARLHKGDILISSTVGTGSRFTIRLLKGIEHFGEKPGMETAEANGRSKEFDHYGEIKESNEKPESVPVNDSAEKTLMLVIEDNDEILNYICQSLKSQFVTITARNGEEGLHLAKTMNPEIIITDIRMPGMDGLEMTRRLKADFITSHIPVIMLTCKSDIEDQLAGIETGAEAYIIKPFNMEYLRTVAANLLHQRTLVLEHFLNGRAGSGEALKINSKDCDFIRKIVLFVEDNCAGDLSIADLADHSGVSRTVLYNKIKGLTGSSPVEFIRSAKLNVALKILDNGFNVSEAAFKTGFSDVKYFSRLFKAKFGYSPGRRKSGTSSGNPATGQQN
ncbi:MAG: two-component regulator propeller domain-containing protein [Bacteroidales bacterium]